MTNAYMIMSGETEIPLVVKTFCTVLDILEDIDNDVYIYIELEILDLQQNSSIHS